MRGMIDLSIGVWNRASPRRKRILSILAVLVVILIVEGLGTSVPLSKQDANQLVSDFNQTVTAVSDQGAFPLTSYILGNNLLICLLMFVPIIGPLLGLLITFDSGIVLAALAVSQGFPPSLYFIALLISPHTWIELAAYSVAMSSSVWLLMRIIRGRGFHELTKNTARFMVISMLLLVAGAIVEVGLVYLLG